MMVRYLTSCLQVHQVLVRPQWQRHCANNYDVIIMLSTVLTRVGFWIRYVIKRRTLPPRYLSRLVQITKSLSSTKQTIPLPMYNSSLERILRPSTKTVDSSLPAIIKTRSLNHSIAGALLWTLVLVDKINHLSQHNSSQE